ncbi:MAG: aminopeptidase, partial [Brevundimonas sp.]|nr:aminopeptidase [Brevundimonas sp.]
MFLKVAAFEFRYQLRQPAFWVIAILFALVGFGMLAMPDLNVSAGGNVYKNAPYFLAAIHVSMVLFFMLGSTVIVANVIVRDVQSGYGPIIQSTQLKPFDYLYGRFAGAFAATALCFAAVTIGMFAGTLAPWIDRETIGPFRPGDYLYAYFVMGLPGVFLTCALFFMLATVTRSLMATYVGVVAVLIAYLVTTGILGSKPELETAMAWAEPLGASAYGLVSKYWTPAEKNTLNVALTGVFLWNRLIWTGVSILLLAATWVFYRPTVRGAKAATADTLRKMTAAAPAAPAATGPLPAPS